MAAAPIRVAITGAAGNITKPLAEKLLSAGAQVTIIGRNAAHLQPLTDKGAKAAIGSIEDVAFLQQAFTGADAVYLMVPPQYAAQGLEAYQQIGANYAAAIKAATVKYAVTLSSVGAHLPQGCGPVTGLYRVEQELNKLTGTNVLHLRPGFFYVNFYGSLSMIKDMNMIGGNYGDSDSCPEPELIAKHEIGGHQCRNHRTADIHSQNGAGRNHEWHHVAHAEEVDDLPRSDRRTGQHGDRKIEVASDQ